MHYKVLHNDLSLVLQKSMPFDSTIHFSLSLSILSQIQISETYLEYN